MTLSSRTLVSSSKWFWRYIYVCSKTNTQNFGFLHEFFLWTCRKLDCTLHCSTLDSTTHQSKNLGDTWVHWNLQGCVLKKSQRFFKLRLLHGSWVQDLRALDVSLTGEAILYVLFLGNWSNGLAWVRESKLYGLPHTCIEVEFHWLVGLHREVWSCNLPEILWQSSRLVIIILWSYLHISQVEDKKTQTCLESTVRIILGWLHKYVSCLSLEKLQGFPITIMFFSKWGSKLKTWRPPVLWVEHLKLLQMFDTQSSWFSLTYWMGRWKKI